jgi:hypothetical protein
MTVIKSFTTFGPVPNVKKLFTDFRNKLEFLSLVGLSRLVYYFWVRQEPTQVKYLSGAPLYGRFLALPTNNKLGWKGAKTFACKLQS